MSVNPARESRDEMLRQQAILHLAMQVRTYATGKDVGATCDYVLLRDAGKQVPRECRNCDGERPTCYLRLAKGPQRVIQ
jgi:hypothetical protein